MTAAAAAAAAAAATAADIFSNKTLIKRPSFLENKSVTLFSSWQPPYGAGVGVAACLCYEQITRHAPLRFRSSVLPALNDEARNNNSRVLFTAEHRGVWSSKTQLEKLRSLL